MSFDILEGAILVRRDTPVCRFTEADCQVSPAGLWGPPAAQLGPDQLKAIERSRTSADTAVRDNYRALVARTKDRDGVKQIAVDQAGILLRARGDLPLLRQRVGAPGSCAARFTEARAAALQAQLGATPPPSTAKKRLSSKKPVVQ